MLEQNNLNSDVYLFVEGKDEKNFFEIYIEHLSLENVIRVEDFEGKDKLTEFLRLFKLRPDFENTTSIGIVRDADDNPKGAFASVQSSLDNNRLPRPGRIGEQAAGPPSVAVAILPGGEKPGMLETLLWESVGDPAIRRCVEDFLQCSEQAGQPIARRDKALAHAFLATRPDPHVSVGVAARKHYWDFDHPAFDGLREFLRTVAGP